MTVTAMPKTDDAAATEKPKKSKKKLIVIVLVVLLAGGAGYWFFLKPSGPVVPKPGAVLPLDEQTLNLAGGHYLKVKVALQLTTKAGEDVDGSKAQQDVIDVLSGLDVGDVNLAKTRQSLQAQLVKKVEADYPDEVMDVYLTEFVTT